MPVPTNVRVRVGSASEGVRTRDSIVAESSTPRKFVGASTEAFGIATNSCSIYCNELSIYSLTIFITMKTLGLSSTPQLKMRKPTGDSHSKCLCSINEWQLLLASVDQSLTLPVPLDGQKLSSYGSDNYFFSFLPILHSRLGLLLSWRAQLPP